VICVAIDFAVYRFLVNQFSYQGDFAKAAGYLSGLVLGFFLNKLWTFESRQARLGEPFLYLGIYSITFVLNLAINKSVLGLLGPNFMALAFLLATGVSTICNFAGLRLLAFRTAVRIT
jgi:putative flippase GtrA